MNRRVSLDGSTWYEISAADFARLLADPEAECWVDVSGDGGGWWLLPLSVVRACQKAPAEPGTLFGIPLVVEGE